MVDIGESPNAPLDYGDRAECDYCGTLLDKPDYPHPQFCADHDYAMWKDQERADGMSVDNEGRFG